MNVQHRKPFLLPLLLGLCLPGCTTTGGFPTLAKRPYEAGQQPPAVADQTEMPALDQQLAERLQAISRNVEGARPIFEAALAKGRPIIQRGNSAGRESEAWVLAQMEISQIERTRAPVTQALGELDLAYREAIQSGRARDADEIRTVMNNVQAIDANQAAAISALSRP